MEKMELALEDAGYFVVNQPYESRHHPIEELAPTAVQKAIGSCGDFDANRRLNFVTHSLGGILVRYFFAEEDHDALARVVMLGPPNQGSSAVDILGGIPGFDLINGPVGKQLGKGDESVPLALGTPHFEFAVIAGDRTIDPITSAVLRNPDDGKVSVEDTKLDGMSDFRVVHVSHAFLMKDDEVIELVQQFLKDGEFAEVDQAE